MGSLGRKGAWLGAAAGLYGAWHLLQRLRMAPIGGAVTLITGGSRGLGFCLAREFAREGATVVVCARKEEELAWARDRLAEEGLHIHTKVCDVGDREQVQTLFREIRQELGPVEVLVNNAGIIQVGPVETTRVEDYEQALRIMFWGMLYPTLEALPEMKAKGAGRIINITSIGGEISVPHLLPYSSAKFAAEGFSKGLAAELGPQGITVTTVVPGLMRTGSYVNVRFQGQTREEYDWFALGATLPVVSMNAQRAARQILQAARQGQVYVVLGAPAKLAARFAGLFPAAMVRILAGVDRWLLPAPAPREPVETGGEVAGRNTSPLESVIGRLGRGAVHAHQPPSELRNEGA